MRTPLGKSLTLRGCDRIYETNLGAKKGRFLRNELESPRRFESYETNSFAFYASIELPTYILVINDLFEPVMGRLHRTGEPFLA
jgi:hypothetical protein